MSSKTYAPTNVQKALDLLQGKTVVAHDRRKTDAHPIDFTQYRYKGSRVLAPSYGISNTMHSNLAKLADEVKFVDGMPRYCFTA